MAVLKDRAVLVTDAARGIGREMALSAAREGATVVVNDLGAAAGGDLGDASPAQEVVEEIHAAGTRLVSSG